MAARSPLPPPEAFAKLLGSLFDKRIHVARAATPLPVAAQRGLCDYVDAAQNVLFVAVCDMALLAGIGAALAMIPAAVVAEAVKTGKPSDALRENAYEVFNIAASVFNEVPGTEIHVKLRALTLIPPAVTALQARIAKPASRLDIDVTVPGYPVGKLSVLQLAS